MLQNPLKGEPCSRAAALSSERSAQGPHICSCPHSPHVLMGYSLIPQQTSELGDPSAVHRREAEAQEEVILPKPFISEVAELGSLASEPQGCPVGNARWFGNLQGPHLQGAPAVMGETLSYLARFPTGKASETKAGAPVYPQG